MNDNVGKFEKKKLGKIFLTAPGPTTKQMFSQLLRARKDPAGFLVDMRKKSGNVVKFLLRILPFYVVITRDDGDRVMRFKATHSGKK